MRSENDFILPDGSSPDLTAYDVDEQPAIEFEKKHNVTGIAGNYRFPTEPGFDRDSMEKTIRRHNAVHHRPDLAAERLAEFGRATGKPDVTFDELRSDRKLAVDFINFLDRRRHVELIPMLEKLEALNPEIASIPFDRKDPKQVYDVVYGVVSGFNTSDIDYHTNIRSRPGERTSPNQHERRSLARRIQPRIGGEQCHWSPSSETLQKIWEQVQERPILPRPLGATNALAEDGVVLRE